MKLRKVSTLCCLLFSMTILQSCGFKGPLITPEQAEQIRQQQQQAQTSTDTPSEDQ